MFVHLTSTISLTDLFIFGAAILFAFYGFKRGALRTLYSILKIYFSFIITIFLYEKLALTLQAMLDMSSSVSRIICFTAVFSIVLSVMWTAEVFVKRRVAKPPETNSDLSKIGGIILGLLEGVLIVSIILMDIAFFTESGSTDGIPLEKTVAYRAVKQIAPSIEAFTVGSFTRLKEVPDRERSSTSEFDNP